jgi:hypothetical protein
LAVCHKGVFVELGAHLYRCLFLGLRFARRFVLGFLVVLVVFLVLIVIEVVEICILIEVAGGRLLERVGLFGDAGERSVAGGHADEDFIDEFEELWVFDLSGQEV